MNAAADKSKIRIVEVTKDSILFDNGKKLVCEQAKPEDRAEYLYFCDFPALKDRIGEIEFDEETLWFGQAEASCGDDCGLILGDRLSEDCGGKTRIFVNTYRIPNPNIAEAWIRKYERWRAPDFDLSGADPEEQREWAENRRRFRIDGSMIDPGAKLIYCGETVLTLNSGTFIEPAGPLPFSDAPVDYDPRTAMTITEVTNEYITFSNGKRITFDHCPDCCENNFADFEQIDDIGRNAVYYENELVFEAIESSGFRFGNRGGLLTFIPCYSCQNGYYTTELDVLYDDGLVLHLEETQFRCC
ncbi:MAG: hypothetical protein IKM31_02175 [Oscillospiraceae bacterium]|nr:hypothetical protein [Oscillospiraceae bacterium]